MGADSPEIQFGNSDGGLFISVLGRPTQRTCPTVSALVEDYLTTHEREAAITIDMLGAEWVDSTFAGWLAGLARRLDRDRGRLVLTGCSQRCRKSLDRMNLGSLFQYETVSPPGELAAVRCTTSDRPDARTLKLMLAAHEHLAAASEQNAEVFAPIVTLLRRQLTQT